MLLYQSLDIRKGFDQLETFGLAHHKYSGRYGVRINSLFSDNSYRDEPRCGISVPGIDYVMELPILVELSLIVSRCNDTSVGDSSSGNVISSVPRILKSHNPAAAFLFLPPRPQILAGVN